MSLSNRKIAVGAAAGLFLTIVAVAILWSDSDETPSLLDEMESEAPIPFPHAWSELGDGQRIHFQASDTPTWDDDGGTTLLRGPTVDGLTFEWSEKQNDDWRIAYGRATGDDVDVQTHIWTAPGFPMAIIDLDAQVSGPALADPLVATTVISGDDAEVVTGGLDRKTTSDGLEDLDLLAARSATTDSTVQVHAPAGASGQTDDLDSDELIVHWTLWPGLADVDGFDDCLDDGPALRQVSLRLVVHFGDHPMAAPLPVAADSRATGTPIFIDAPSTENGNDGAARDADDFARRLRALAFGHSDREDPRYGNGGLLAADMGAVFAIPAYWWHEESIAALRQSLEDTGIEVIPSGDFDDEDDGEPPSTTTQLIAPGDCQALFAPENTDRADLSIVYESSDNSPFRAPLTASTDPAIEIGTSPPERSEVLGRLFDSDHRDGLFTSGDHRALFLPVVATRNPLVDVDSEKILTPDRNRHWTLHDSLTRRLSRLEMGDPDLHRRSSTSFEDLRDHRRRHADAVPYWTPDGSLEHSAEDAPHLYFFGNTDAIAPDVDEQHSRLVPWNLDDADSPEYGDTLEPATVEFDLP